MTTVTTVTKEEVALNAIYDEAGLEWVPATVAARMVPSVRSGKRTHAATIRTWVRAGRLAGKVRRAGGVEVVYVRTDQVAALLDLADLTPRPPRSATISLADFNARAKGKGKGQGGQRGASKGDRGPGAGG